MAAVTTWDPGRLLHNARRDSGLKQRELAVALDVSRPLVSKWERNKAEPTISQWRAMIRLFNDRGVDTRGLTSLTWMNATVAA